MDEIKVVKSAFREKLWSVSAYVKPGLVIYILLWLNFFLTLMFIMPEWNLRLNEEWKEYVILFYVFLPIIVFMVASGVVTKLVMIIRSKKLYRRGRVFTTTIGIDQDSEKKDIEEVRDEANKLLIPKSILFNVDGLSPWKWRGNKFCIAPADTILQDGIMEELEGGDYSWYKASQLPHPALTEHLYREEIENNGDGTITKKIIPIMPNFSYKDSMILWSPTGWNSKKQIMIGEGCPSALLKWQRDRETKLEDEVRYWRHIKEKTVVVTKEGAPPEGTIS